MLARASRFVSFVGLALISLPCWIGCSGGGVTQTQDSGPLTELGKAYVEATYGLDRAPTSADELKPYLPAGKDVNSLLTSPMDSKPYVIIWGTDPRQGMDLKPLVIGYEQTSSGGTRLVFTAMGVSLMDEKDFKEAKFPAGHTPP